MSDAEKRYLLTKHDLYYLPDSCGYTGVKERAGRYLKSDESPERGVVAVHEDDAPDYSPACYNDVKYGHIQGQLATLEAENARLREALEFYAENWRDNCGDHGVPVAKEPNDHLHNDWGDRARAALKDTEEKSDDAG